jgi:hypothetical protein
MAAARKRETRPPTVRCALVMVGVCAIVAGYLAAPAADRSPVRASDTPPNDNFAAAADITMVPFSATGIDATAATVESGEPGPAAVDAVVMTTWYRLAATSGGAYHVILPAPAGARGGLVFACAYTGQALNSLATTDCADSRLERGATSWGGPPLVLGFETVPGETYWIQIGGWNAPPWPPHRSPSPST